MDNCIKVGSIDRLVQYVNNFSHKIVSEPDLRFSNLKFAGLPVIESKLLPENILVQIERGQVCRILDLNKIDWTYLNKKPA